MPTRVTQGFEITVERRRPIGKWARRAGKALGVGGAGFLSGALALAYYVEHSITAPTATTPFDAFTFTPFEFGAPYESVAFPTGGSATLRGWLLPFPSRGASSLPAAATAAVAPIYSASAWRYGATAITCSSSTTGAMASLPARR